MSKISGKEIWVYIDLRDQRLFGFSLNVMARARELADAMSGKMAVVFICSPVDDESSSISRDQECFSISDAVSECISHGADQLYIFENTRLAVPRADLYATVLSNAVQERSPLLVLFALTDFCREVAARSACICNAGLIADCVDLRISEDNIIATCPAWGGDIMSEITFSDGFSTGFATVQPHSFSAVEVKGKPGTIERIKVDNLIMPKGLKLLARSPEPKEHRKLEEADIVVVGGAGLGSIDGFGLVRQFAAAIGGEVGATRPPVLQHWVNEDQLIGQTGKTVRPSLLFSVGTSGALQYTAGILESKTIVAINRDRDAPIFQVADIGVIADAKIFVPLLTDKAKQSVMRNLADVLGKGNVNDMAQDTGFGEKIQKLRESQNWSRETLAKATGQSPEFISQVETNEISPPVSFLVRLAGALDVDPGTFLNKEEKNILRDQRTQAFIKRTLNYSYETLTPEAENSHLRSFMVTIESHHDHKPVAYKHEGEEFIYVMEGLLEFTLGNKIHKLKKGESIHFNSDIPHKLKSLSNELTKCLVTLYTL